MKKLFFTLLFVISYACSLSAQDEYIGIIKIFAGNFAPTGWRICDGSVLQISQYAALYSIIGTMYGGNGSTTFALPDLRGRAPIGCGQGTNLTNRILGTSGGSESVTLTAGQIPAHRHSMNVADTLANSLVPTNNSMIAEGRSGLGVSLYKTNPTTTTQLLDSTIGYNSGGQSHENMMPYLPINYIICTEGLYPTRP